MAFIDDIIEHIPTLQKICFQLEAQTILELGVRSGCSTKAFLEAARILDAKVTSVDIDDCSRVTTDPRWTFHHMDSLAYNPPHNFDVIFIDTSHTYEQTIQELNKFVPYANGVVLLHDTISCPPVMEAIQHYLLDNDVYCFENHENNNGLGVLWMRAL